MPDKPFVVNDRRKFTADGDLRPDAPPSEPRPPIPDRTDSINKPSAAAEEPRARGPQVVPPQPVAAAPKAEGANEDQLPPPPTTEQLSQATRAYEATVDRLDTAIRAANPGAERMPPMSFDRLVQSIYMQAIMQLGGATEPGQPPQVDILGARQSIDMLRIIAEKAAGNLSEGEQTLLDSAMFEMRMGFLEVTQALSRQAAARQQGPGMPPIPTGPSLVS